MSKGILSDVLARAALCAVKEIGSRNVTDELELFYAANAAEYLDRCRYHEDAQKAIVLRKAVQQAMEKVLANYDHCDSEQQLMP